MEAAVGAGVVGDAYGLADRIIHQCVEGMVHCEVAVKIDPPEQPQQATGVQVGAQQIADVVALHRLIVKLRAREVGEREVDPHVCGQRCGRNRRGEVRVGKATLIRKRRHQQDRCVGTREQ